MAEPATLVCNYDPKILQNILLENKGLPASRRQGLKPLNSEEKTCPKKYASRELKNKVSKKKK